MYAGSAASAATDPLGLKPDWGTAADATRGGSIPKFYKRGRAPVFGDSGSNGKPDMRCAGDISMGGWGSCGEYIDDLKAKANTPGGWTGPTDDSEQARDLGGKIVWNDVPTKKELTPAEREKLRQSGYELNPKTGAWEKAGEPPRADYTMEDVQVPRRVKYTYMCTLTP